MRSFLCLSNQMWCETGANTCINYIYLHTTNIYQPLIRKVCFSFCCIAS